MALFETFETFELRQLYHCLDILIYIVSVSFPDPVLQYLLSNIQDPKLSSVSASAIESLCMSCFTQMAKYFDVLAQV